MVVKFTEFPKLFPPYLAKYIYMGGGKGDFSLEVKVVKPHSAIRNNKSSP